MYEIIFNPGSRSNHGASVWNTIEKILNEKDIEYLLYKTTHAGHAEEMISDITSDGKPHTFLVIGGDGTLNEVVNGLKYPNLATIGLIPFGSGNDFAKAMNIPTDPAKALDLILSCTETTPINFGETHLPNSYRRFIISCGMGFDSDVCTEVQTSRLKPILNKIGMGKLVYTLIGIKKLITKSVFSGKIKFDDNEPFNLDNIFFLTAMNTIYEGGGYKFCPDATPTDDKLDFLMVNNLSRPEVLPLLPKAKKGTHLGKEGINISLANRISIRLSKAVYLHTDGEVYGKFDNIRINCAAEHINFYLKENDNDN